MNAEIAPAAAVEPASLAAAVERGLPFALIAGAGLYSTAKPTSMMIVAKNSPLKTAKDLSGKTVAVLEGHVKALISARFSPDAP